MRLLAPLLLALPAATPAQELPSSVDLDETTIQHCGDVKLRVFGGLITIGKAGLYLQDCARTDRIMDNVPQQFSVLLGRDADGERLTRMARDGLEDNLSESTRQQLDDTFRCMTEAYRDAETGRRYDVRYLPGHGLQLWLDDELLADCPCGPEGAGYFSIWFGNDPFNTKMKQALLQQARRTAGDRSG